jgi:cytoskeletal protein CcmA (bactofilin family)
MWSKQQAAVTEPPGFSPSPAPSAPANPFNQPSSLKFSSVPARGGARLGASIQIKGEVTGAEDLQIDGIVEGPIRIKGHELTVGPAAQLTSEIHAGDVVAFGKIMGNVHARGRVDIKKDGSITGDISSARISIEDGAYFKGRIEIDPTKAPTTAAD